MIYLESAKESCNSDVRKEADELMDVEYNYEVKELEKELDNRSVWNLRLTTDLMPFDPLTILYSIVTLNMISAQFVDCKSMVNATNSLLKTWCY